MEPVVRIESRAVPLLLDDVDTDVITPIQRVLEGMASLVEHAFEPIRFRADGSLDPDCPLNDPRYAGAAILIAGRNFGCGSSRETAAWAVKGLGFRCVVASSFGDIFRSNCFKNGLLPITVAPAEAAALGAEARTTTASFVVDLEQCTITTPGGRVVPFAVSALRREALLHGLDDLGLTLRRREALDAFERRDRAARPWAYPDGGDQKKHASA